MRKEYQVKEEQYQRMEVELNILKVKLEKQYKHLRFQDSTNILDNILSNQRSHFIKFGLGFHEIVKGESISQDCTRILKDSNTKYDFFCQRDHN